MPRSNSKSLWIDDIDYVLVPCCRRRIANFVVRSPWALLSKTRTSTPKLLFCCISANSTSGNEPIFLI